MRLLGYTRISTASQDAQLQLDALASVGVEARDVFSDVTSGSKTAAQRPGMRRLLDYATPGDTVVVWRVDRLGRSLIDVLNTVNRLTESGIAVRSVQDGIDPATTSGRLMLNMLATLAEYERELIIERVNAGIAAAKASGTRFGRPRAEPDMIAEKLQLATDARAKGRTANQGGRPGRLVTRHAVPAPKRDDLSATHDTSSTRLVTNAEHPDQHGNFRDMVTRPISRRAPHGDPGLIVGLAHKIVRPP